MLVLQSGSHYFCDSELQYDLTPKYRWPHEDKELYKQPQVLDSLQHKAYPAEIVNVAILLISAAPLR